jgi:hypothetical protein
MGFSCQKAIEKLMFAMTAGRVDASYPIIKPSQHTAQPSKAHCCQTVKKIFVCLNDRNLGPWSDLLAPRTQQQSPARRPTGPCLCPWLSAGLPQNACRHQTPRMRRLRLGIQTTAPPIHLRDHICARRSSNILQDPVSNHRRTTFHRGRTCCRSRPGKAALCFRSILQELGVLLLPQTKKNKTQSVVHEWP